MLLVTSFVFFICFFPKLGHNPTSYSHEGGVGMIIEGTNRPRPVGTGGTPNGPSRGLKRMLLGAGAGLFTVASAQAADLPVKAAPVEYVKVCSLYGAGFFYMPGTATCLKIGGYLRTDHVYGSASQANYYLAVPQAQFSRLATD